MKEMKLEKAKKKYYGYITIIAEPEGRDIKDSRSTRVYYRSAVSRGDFLKHMIEHTDKDITDWYSIIASHIEEL